MPRQLEDFEDEKLDIFEQLINTPEDKLSQLTNVPDGCIQGFSGMETIARTGENDELPQDIFRREFYRLRRSKDGTLMLSLVKLALEKTASESNPDTTPGFLND